MSSKRFSSDVLGFPLISRRFLPKILGLFHLSNCSVHALRMLREGHSRVEKQGKSAQALVLSFPLYMIDISRYVDEQGGKSSSK